MHAEHLFRQAFERLKSDSPQILNKGSSVSQNNIAREAGCDPSALRKQRYPALIAEIQVWIEGQGNGVKHSKNQRLNKQRLRNRTLAERLKDTKQTCAIALSMLADADAKILELTMEIERLQTRTLPDNVKPFKSKDR
ncbi:hypothetical protein PseuLF5_13695 [Pseudomonas sp. LF-5]|uniref:hypothetical protein n=1 Tax=Pseudomonas sp. LF-5 TaxID=3031121 RepID=UPI0030955E1C